MVIFDDGTWVPYDSQLEHPYHWVSLYRHAIFRLLNPLKFVFKPKPYWNHTTKHIIWQLEHGCCITVDWVT